MNTTGARVFVVEDEPVIVENLRHALEDGGFEVGVALNGGDAMALLNAMSHEFCAVITDVDLADDKITGWDVAHRAREIVPDIPVVYTTGGKANEWSANGVPNSVLITKPFALAQVLTAVSQLLNMRG